MADPSLEVCLDFTSNLFMAIQEDLVNATGATHQAVAVVMEKSGSVQFSSKFREPRTEP